MANFDKAMEVLNKLEFSNSSNFLHKNATEKDYTVGGIYKYANQAWHGWFMVRSALDDFNNDIEEASKALYHNSMFRRSVNMFYRKEYWDKMKLDEIHSDKIATEIFCFGVNAGRRTAIRKAQKIVCVKEDGLIGPVTIEALNCYDEDDFDIEFDEIELQYYTDLIESKPSFAIYKNGFKNRAYSV